jgi:hypothetical protein
VIEVRSRDRRTLLGALRFDGEMSLEELIIRHALGEDVRRMSSARGRLRA